MFELDIIYKHNQAMSNFLIIANFLIANCKKSGPDHLQLLRSDSILIILNLFISELSSM